MLSENAGAAGGFVIYAVVKSVSSSPGDTRSTEGAVRVRFGVLLLGDVGLFALLPLLLLLLLLAVGYMDAAASVMQAQFPVLLQRPQPRGSGLPGRVGGRLRALRRRMGTEGAVTRVQRTFSRSSVQTQLTPHVGVSWPDDGAGEATWVKKLLAGVDWCPNLSCCCSSSSLWRDSSLALQWPFSFASSVLSAASCWIWSW